jgi:hypothetical protein
MSIHLTTAPEGMQYLSVRLWASSFILPLSIPTAYWLQGHQDQARVRLDISLPITSCAASKNGLLTVAA